MAGLRNRTELQNLFRTGAKPSGQDFTDLVNSVLNINDDGIEKPAGADTPLKILAHGDTENVLDFYTDETHTWRINQKPTGANPGLNLAVNEDSKLFIESGAGNVGISTTQPTAKLHIQQLGSQDALRIDDETNETTPLIVDADGNVGLGTVTPDRKLHIETGELRVRASHTHETPDIGAFYTHDLTQGIGIGRNRIAAIGSDPDQEIRLVPKGTSNVVLDGAGVTVTGTDPSSFVGNVGIGTTNPKLHLSIGDSDTGLKQQGDGILAIFTNDRERVRIDNAGNVGIGLDKPGERLEIAGNLRVTGAISGNINASQVNSGTLAVARIPSLSASQITGGTLNGSLSVSGNVAVSQSLAVGQTAFTGYQGITADTNDLVVNGQLAAGGSGGSAIYKLGIGYAPPTGDEGTLIVSKNMGIGTDKPTAMLHLSSTGSVKILLEADTTNKDEAAQPQVQFKQDGGGIFSYIGFADKSNALRISHATNSDQSTLEFQTQATTRMVIDPDGNVGIGKTNPGEKLEISGNLKVSGSITGDIKATQIKSGTLDVDRIPNLAASKITSGTLGVDRIPKLAADKITGGTLKGNLAITGKLEVTDNVGIGTTNPSAPLHLKATSETSPDKNGLYVYNSSNSANQHAILSVRVAGSKGGDPFVSWDINGEAGWCMGIDNSDSNKLKVARAWNSLTSNTSMTLDTNGNVGIGTTKPTDKLTLAGTLAFTDDSYRPFQIKKFTGGDSLNIDTGYSNSNWAVIVAGFYLDNRDGDASKGTYIYTYVKSGKWWLRADVRSAKDSWEINILAIRKNWVQIVSQLSEIT